MRAEAPLLRAGPSVAIIREVADGVVLDRADLDGLLPSLEGTATVLILVDLGGVRLGDPDIVSPRTVEALIDLLAEQSGVQVTIGATRDSTSLWAGNRDVYALAELHGYRFETDKGYQYDIIDLAEETADDLFPLGSVLHKTPASTVWMSADLRINLAALRRDGAESFEAGLANLIGALPLTDKLLHYRQRRSASAVVSALIKLRPPDLTIIYGSGLGTSPAEALVVASPDASLADYVAALKLEMDPFGSALFAGVVADHPLPCSYQVLGSLAPITDRPSVAPLVARSRRAAQANESVDRLLAAWTKPLDPSLFPANLPLDARAQELLASLVGNDGSVSGTFVATLIDLAAAAIGKSLEAWRTLAEKDALVRYIVPMNVDADAIALTDFADAVVEMDSLRPLAASAPERGPHLRWRKVQHAVVFEYQKTLPIPFDRFVEAVDVARAIQFMNDYLGGVIVPLERDALGRSIRQIERNLYLPQPNYLALYQGQPIDVTKIEVVRYGEDRHELYWKTVKSANGSAEADDGIVSFARVPGGTHVAITGKQHFILPPFWRFFDISLLPEVETALTTHAYQTFFDRTLSNFEALVEGRDIRIGIDPMTDTPHPSIAIEAAFGRWTSMAEPWLERFRPVLAASPAQSADGFVHVVPAP